MKTKFVQVWDDMKLGYVKFIILQVEETDTFLTSANFNPGYKFIVEASYKRVGAAGGHEFNPYYGNRVREVSKKIDSTEADVLGFCLGNVDDIYDIPDELYTKPFWNVVRTDNYRDKDGYIDDDSYENCYKAIITTGTTTIEETINRSRKAIELMPEIYTENQDVQLSDLCKSIDKFERECKRLDADFNKETKYLKLIFIDKETLEIVGGKSSSYQQGIVSNYLWLPYEELPLNLWSEVKENNEDYYFYRIYRLEEDIKI